MKSVTIADVAEYANVSKSTVSAVINDRDVVKESTRQRVLDAVAKLNYRPSGSAQRGFKASSGKSIGFVIKETDNPYYTEVLTGIQDVATENEYLTFVSSSGGHFETEKNIVKQFSSKDVDGLIITPILNDETDLLHIFDLKRNNVPFVLLENVRGIQANLVDVDNVQASYNAVKHLIELGHDRIIHFAGPAYSKHSEERAEGVRRAFSTSTLVFNADCVVRTGDSLKEGYRQALDYFGTRGEKATAVTCYNDLVALGVMKALRELDISVPDAVSVVGFDNISVLDYVPTPLTTVRVPKQKMGKEAARMLLQEIESSDPQPPRKLSLDAELVIRSSTAPPQR